MMANILWIVALKLSLRWGLVNKKNQLLVLGLETSGVELGSVRLAGWPSSARLGSLTQRAEEGGSAHKLHLDK